MINKLIVFISLSVILVSCGETPLYQKSVSFEGREWSDDQDLFYEFESTDEKQVLDFKLLLRTTSDFNYNNLWIYFSTETPNGEVAREPYQIRISDPQDGSWLGKRSGSVVETAIDFAKVQLPEKGLYKFKVEQAVTQSEVDEVLDMTLIIKKSEL